MRGVVAARAGTVTHAGVVGSSGLTVAVRTADGRHVTSYLHLSAVAVTKGDAVAAGARIGAVGTSGRRTVAEPHLHFGIRLAEPDDRYIDPLSLLPPLSSAPPPAASVPPPVPVRVAPRAAPVPIPLAGRARAVPHRAPAREPARFRPQGTFHPGPAVAPQPSAAPRPAAVHTGLAPQRQRVPSGPTGVGSPAHSAPPEPAADPTPAAAPAAVPTPQSGPGHRLVLVGLGLIALVLFGGAWRAFARANAGVNGGAAAAVAWLRAAVSFGRVRPTISSSGARRR